MTSTSPIGDQPARLTPDSHRSSSPTIARSIWQLIGVSISIVTILIAGFSMGLRLITRERAEIARTETIERNLRALGEDLLDAETGQRGYLLTGEERYLDPYESGSGNIHTRIAELQKLMSDASARQGVESIIPVVNAKLDELTRTIVLAKSGQRDAALRMVAQGTGKQLMDQFRSLRTNTLDREQQLLAERRQRINDTNFRLQLLLVSVGILAILLSVLLAHRTIDRLRKPIRTLITGLRTAAAETLERPIPIDAYDEIGDITVAFNAMAADLAASRHAAHTSHRRLQQLYVSTPAMLHSVDPAGRLLTVSDQWLATLGFERDEVLGRPSTDFLTEQSAEFAKTQGFPALFHTGSITNAELQMRHKDGRVINVLLSAIVERDERGDPQRCVAAIIDISRRKRVERALTESQELLERVESLACVGGFKVDLMAQTVSWTRQSYRIHDVDEAVEPTFDLIYRCMSAEARSIVDSAWSMALATGQGYDIAIPITTAKNRPVWLRVVGSVESIDGRAVSLVGALQDITARRQADLSLRASEQRLQLISDNIPGLISHLDRDLRYQFVNRAYADWFGIDPSTLLGMTVKEFYGAQIFANIEAPLRMALTGQTVTDEREVLARGVLRHCHVVLIPQRNVDNEVIGLFAIHTDITKRRLAELALRESENFLARTGTVAGVGGWELDLRNRAITWSNETCRLHDVEPGYRPKVDDAINFYAPASRPVIAEALQNCTEHGLSFDVELELISARGRPFWARATGAAEFEGGNAVRIAGAFQDVTARRRLESELADHNELLKVTLDSIGDAVITTDATGHIEWLNPVAERMTGWTKEAGRGRALTEVFRIVNAETREPATNPIAVCLGEQRVVGLANHTLLIARHGAEYHIEDSASPIRTAEGRILGAVLVFHDVSEQRRLSNEMTHRATHDALTGLVNRAEFEVRLARLLARARTDGTLHILMYIDLDEFKVVNDACGHAAGDQLLRQVSALLEGSVRGRDTVARLGGDEFGLLLENCNLEQGRLIAQKICDQMEVYRFSHDGKRYRVGTSIGVVPIDERWQTTAAVLQAADSGCYAAKEAGRNRVHLWLDTDGTIQARQGEMQWVNRLVNAMDEGLFVLHAQRIAPVQGNGARLHCEVLLRLREANGTIILPSAFLPAAERFHLASRIDRWVVGRVFELLGSGAFDLCSIDMIAVNLSGQSIGDRAFHRDIAKMITDASFDLHKLCFEITETAAITHLGDAKSFIDEVRAQGVRVALDDFGAGSSSFGYLRTLPVDFLKIDGQFITGFLDDPLDNAAVHCFTQVAKVVGVKTIAECVEREDIRQALQTIGVDMAQGYLIHRPEPLEELLPGKTSVIDLRGPLAKSANKWRKSTAQ